MAQQARPRIPFTAGDRLPELQLTYVGQNLTGSTITLHVDRPNIAVLIKSAVAVNLSEGQFKFSWAAGDLVEGLGQPAEVQVVNPSSEPLTIAKFLLDVAPEIA